MSTEEFILPSTPDNLNNLYVDKFQFSIRKLPGVSFMCSEANIPGISVKVLETATPHNPIRHGGKKVEFNEFSLTFKIDEDLTNWKTVYRWIRGIGSPGSFDDFKNLVESHPIPKSGYNYFSDGTLVSLTNSQNVNIKISIKDMFPTSLSDINFNQGSTGEIGNGKVSFAYLMYDFF